jgi:hypothetical protein
MKRLVPLLLVSMLLLGGCSSEPKAKPSPSTSSPARLSSTAVLRIVSPTAGQQVPTSGVEVKISLSGARIVGAGTRANRPDEGHVHLRVDGMTITLFGGLEVSTGKLTPGAHLIEVEFAESDHSPFNPRVIQRVTVTAA